MSRICTSLSSRKAGAISKEERVLENISILDTCYIPFTDCYINDLCQNITMSMTYSQRISTDLDVPGSIIMDNHSSFILRCCYGVSVIVSNYTNCSVVTCIDTKVPIRNSRETKWESFKPFQWSR